MDEEQNYKLITCVDPRKINVPIRDRFSKLTLSNKKKQKEPEIDLEKNPEPLKRVSRNLLETLDTALDSKSSSSSSKLTDIPHYVNPLLSSESSSSIPVTQVNDTHSGEVDESSSYQSTYSEQMQPLQVSENIDNHNSLDEEISTLTREVSVMAVSVKDSNINRNDKIAHETTLLVSTESQRMSYEFHTQRLQTRTVKLQDNDGSSGSNEKDLQSVCISLSSSTDDNCSAITVTDSSASDFMDFDVMTSEIPISGCSADAFLPNTFSNEKADRMEAFLRDVSQQRREIEENLEIDADNFTLLSVNDDKNTSGDRFQGKQPGELAYADTESMTTFSTEQRISDDNKTKINDLKKNEPKRNIKLEPETDNDTLSMTRIQSDFKVSSNSSILNQKDKVENSKRLADDETQMNNSLTENDPPKKPSEGVTLKQIAQQEDKDFSIVCSEQSFNSDSIKTDIPEDSVVISETSSENVSGYSVHDSKINSGDMVNSDCSQGGGDGNTEVQISPQHMEIGSINISAKINIKISISQIDSLEDEYEKESEEMPKDNSSSGGENNEEVSVKSASMNTLTSVPDDNQLLQTTCDEQKQERSIINQSHNAIESNINEVIQNSNKEDVVEREEEERTEGTGEEEEDINFLTHAERLLNQVYGMSWKTPEVIRTLKRTSRTPKKNCTPSPRTSKTPTSFKEVNINKPAADVESASEATTMDQSVEQSVLDDFSIFRRDIVRTNLDSTRFTTPKAEDKRCGRKTERNNFTSEPRCTVAKRNEQQQLQDFKVPRTEVRRKLPPRQRRQNVQASAERWRQIVDDDSKTSGDNASDDDTLDKTHPQNDDSMDAEKENKHVNDKEWNPSESENSDDSDVEIHRPCKGKKGQRRKQNEFKTPSNMKTNSTRRQRGVRAKTKDTLIYLDLSKDEVTILEGEPTSPLANNDANFNTRLESILRTCKATEKTKLPATPNTGGKSKRKLFTANFGEEDVDLTVGEDGVQPRTPVKARQTPDEDILLKEMEQVTLNDGSSGGAFAIFNKHLEFIKRGDPIFKVTPPRVTATPKTAETPKPFKSSRILREHKKLTDQLCSTPNSKYGFLKSLDVCVSKAFCHPDALCYRENYRTKKEELAKLLYELYNEKLFENKLNVPLQWNKKLCNTAGRCLNKKKMGMRTSVIELSEKVLTSADRLRCTLIHELCHAATWIFSGEGGHGSTWKQWALKANCVFPEIPKIGVCHQYDIEYKYTYKCTLCAAKSHAHSKSKKVENIRCSFCHGAIEIFLNKKDKDGNILPIPVREPTGFAKFVKDNYKQYKRPEHADVMKLLSAEFAALKVPDCTT